MIERRVLLSCSLVPNILDDHRRRRVDHDDDRALIFSIIIYTQFRNNSKETPPTFLLASLVAPSNSLLSRLSRNKLRYCIPTRRIVAVVLENELRISFQIHYHR